MRISDWSSDVCSSDLGRVIPSSKAQVIQSAEPTTIEEILVRSGQKVSKGQLLVRLDDAMLASELGQLQAETRSLTADRKSVVKGKSVSVSVDLGVRRIITKTKSKRRQNINKDV